MNVNVLRVQCYVLNMRTRMPFKYGIASMTALPHLFMRMEAVIDGRLALGVSSEGLPPKWFTKNPETLFEDDLDEMLNVIRAADEYAVEIGAHPSFFAWWKTLDGQTRDWGKINNQPPLLTGLGVSLVERALIDAFCRANALSVAQAIHANAFEIDLGAVHPSLRGSAPTDWLPSAPSPDLIARHTVGLGDPLTDEDLSSETRIDDGLPETLEECIRAYGLTHFKIKITGVLENDLPRLCRIANLLQRESPDFRFTLDGNEQFKRFDAFRAFWDELRSEDSLAVFFDRLLFVEQPLHRDVALEPDVNSQLAAWRDRPPIIIDESDGEMNSLVDALRLGYAGTSHKNCKGVIKGIINGCYIAEANRRTREVGYILSGEDLANIGPIALLQDVAIMAALGIEHVERNGHHYFAGLSMYPEAIQESVLQRHNDLYRRHQNGFPTLRIQRGRFSMHSVSSAPFGYDFEFDPTLFTPLERWDKRSLSDD